MMKRIEVIGQFGLILSFFYVGKVVSEWLSRWILIPGSIVGMLLLFMALMAGLVQLKHVEKVSGFFLKHMGFFFIPLGVSLIESYVDIQPIWWQVIILLILSNILVMGITGRVVAYVMKKRPVSQEVGQ